MSLERKPLYLTLDSIKQFELPNTASAVGIDLNTGKQIYYNTSSLGWAYQETYSGSNAIFGDITYSSEAHFSICTVDNFYEQNDLDINCRFFVNIFIIKGIVVLRICSYSGKRVGWPLGQPASH